MTDADSDMRAEEMGEQFEIDHEKIHQVARDIATARDLPDLLQRLAEFRAGVTAHFRQEEAPGGFFEFVRTRTSGNLGRVHDVEDEHTSFLAAIDQLDRRIRECLAGPIADILRQAGEMVERLKRHEAAEGKLLMDALYTDSGAEE